MRAINAALVSTVLVLASCAGVSGNGKVMSESRSHKGFSSIRLSGSGALRVHKGDFAVTVTSDSNILPFVTTAVEGDSLVIGFKPGVALFRATKLEYDVSLPELSGLAISGSGSGIVDRFSGTDCSLRVSGSGRLAGGFDYSKLELSISGSGEIELSASAESLEAKLSGSGALGLEGKAARGSIGLSGSGRVEAKNFAFDELGVEASGSGRIEARVVKNLSARLSGSGDMRYWGKPSVDSHVSGSGRIQAAGD